MDYAQLLSQPTPQQLQMIQAEKLRARQEQAAALQQASAQGSRFDTLAAVAQMANNQGAAGAAQMAAKSAQSRHKPVSLGAQGFALPESGQFIPSTVYQDEQDDRRQQARLLLAAQLSQREQAAEQAAELKRQRMGDQREASQQRHALGRLMAEIAQQRADAATTRLSEPKPVSVAQQKLDAANEAELDARESVSSTLDSLVGHYQALQRAGGIQDTKQGVLNNTMARLRSSAVGQTLGGAAGTEEQSIRNSITATIPLLMTDIKNATGLSASQMNSNVELKLYLAAATDPTKDVQSNLRAIAELDRRFGNGALSKRLGLSSQTQPARPVNQPPQQIPAGISPAEWAAMTPQERAMFQ